LKKRESERKAYHELETVQSADDNARFFSVSEIRESETSELILTRFLLLVTGIEGEVIMVVESERRRELQRSLFEQRNSTKGQVNQRDRSREALRRTMRPSS